MTVIKLPKRFNEKVAEGGRWFDITDEFDQSYGSFKCSLFDKSSASYRLAHKRWIEENKKALETDKLTGDQLAFKIFIDICLHDWKGLVDEDDKPVPFSKKAAYDLFNSEDGFWLADEVTVKASDIRNFQGNPEVEAKVDAKKSQTT